MDSPFAVERSSAANVLDSGRERRSSRSSILEHRGSFGCATPAAARPLGIRRNKLARLVKP
jgi:hypothetical protein